jgi:hypothetical protein
MVKTSSPNRYRVGDTTRLDDPTLLQSAFLTLDLGTDSSGTMLHGGQNGRSGMICGTRAALEVLAILTARVKIVQRVY